MDEYKHCEVAGSFKILSKLPTLNEYIEAERTNRFMASALKKKYTKLCAGYALQMPKLPDALYDLHIHWQVDNNRHDSDNIYYACKYLIDGVVSAGKLRGDGRKFIRNIHHTIETGKTYEITVSFYRA